MIQVIKFLLIFAPDMVCFHELIACHDDKNQFFITNFY
jgi:hypothetical protein